MNKFETLIYFNAIGMEIGQSETKRGHWKISPKDIPTKTKHFRTLEQLWSWWGEQVSLVANCETSADVVIKIWDACPKAQSGIRSWVMGNGSVQLDDGISIILNCHKQRMTDAIIERSAEFTRIIWTRSEHCFYTIAQNHITAEDRRILEKEISHAAEADREPSADLLKKI